MPAAPGAGSLPVQTFGDGVRRALTELLRTASESVVPLTILVIGLVGGFLVGRLVRRLLLALGIDEAVEGTAFERAAGRIGTSTVGIIATLTTAFLYLITIGITLELAALLDTRLFVPRVTAYFGDMLVAVIILVTGLVLADVAELGIRERLEGVKLPEVNLLPGLVKYSLVYVAALLALAHLGVATTALLVLLGGYVFGVVFLGGLALRDLLRATAAGVYLLLAQPYGIGDRIEVDGHRGIVQEVDVLVTRVESNGEELILPNHLIFQSGVVRIRG
jgi:small-conductance mechanosensitive channel